MTVRTLKFTLTAATKDGMYNPHRKENETVYHYTSGSNKVAFHAHPTQAFSYVRVAGKHNHYIRVVNKFIEQGMNQNRYKGGFEEAIKEIEI